MTQIVIIFCVILLSLTAKAADFKGNGGDVLVCEQRGSKSYESFDLYERHNYRLKLAFSFTDGATYVIDEIIRRLQALDPQRACLYQKYLKQFPQEARFEERQPEPINDEGIPIIPRHCHLEQAVNQSTYSDAEGVKYRFYGPLVAQLSELHRTGLFFHEFVYRDGLAHNRAKFVDSQEVRYFTAFLFSTQFFEGTQKRYNEMLTVVRLPSLSQQCP